MNKIIILLTEKNNEINKVNKLNNDKPIKSNLSLLFPFSSGIYFLIYGIVISDKKGSINNARHPIYVEINPPASIPTAPDSPTHAVLYP